MLWAPGRWPPAYSLGVRTSITVNSPKRAAAWAGAIAVEVVMEWFAFLSGSPTVGYPWGYVRRLVCNST